MISKEHTLDLGRQKQQVVVFPLAQMEERQSLAPRRLVRNIIASSCKRCNNTKSQLILVFQLLYSEKKRV